MIDYVIPIVQSFLPVWDYVLIYIFCGYFVMFAFNFLSKIWRS